MIRVFGGEFDLQIRPFLAKIPGGSPSCFRFSRPETVTTQILQGFKKPPVGLLDLYAQAWSNSCVFTRFCSHFVMRVTSPEQLLNSQRKGFEV
jgi:hypothetical protein